jgi:hypothetical protein
MVILKRSMGVLLASLGLFIAPVVLADSPVSLDKPDSHSVEVKGKVKLFRVQIEDMNLGEGKDKVNAEVFIQLDSKPGMIYSLSLNNPVNKTHDPVKQEMADTLRAAYINKTPVTIYHQIDMKRTNLFKIIMVQLN